MKRKIKIWMFRLMVLMLFFAGILLLVILNPSLTYAHKTTHNHFTVFHNNALDPIFLTQLDQANELLKSSEFYNPELRLDVCLNDGSGYPDMIRVLRGRAFAWGFYDKVVMQGNASYKNNEVELNGYRWNLTQLLAHEMIHCLQFDKLGLWKSKPVASIPNWKWEGYAEYISRKSVDNQDLLKNIELLNASDKNNWEVLLSDNTISPRVYYEGWILVQFCMDIQKMSYEKLLSDTTGRQIVEKEMLDWYGKQK
ncbi:MAG: hypothetical protein K1X92_09485 [Bacteroidia bacterium]|nr:hypothetical protein [Bacteroidia bacterium]